MLKELYIDNLAVIKKANIYFDNNLNVFTGETGAGKSILINGINSILGQRTTKDIVRNGCQKSVIVALFSDIPEKVKNKIISYGFECENNEISITREISSDGGSTARINSRPATISALREIGDLLINIHGQHDNQILLNSDNHLDVLDNFAELNNYLTEYQQSFRTLQETAREIKKLVLDDNIKKQRISEIQEFVSEVKTLNIQKNEDETVEKKYYLAKNSAELLRTLYSASVALSGNDNETGAVSLCNEGYNNLHNFCENVPEIKAVAERINACAIELEDINSEISALIDKTEVNPEELEDLGERFNELTKIKSKYGPTLNDVLTRFEKESNELLLLENSETEIIRLNKIKNEQLQVVTEKAERLSNERKKASERFIHDVSEELAFLDMPNVKLDVNMTKGKLTINGMDNVEFLISANIGEPPKPISKIASGGELSRIMLALKNVLADKDDIPTLIFDEIDTGVSGRAAQKIGIKLSEISRYRQVICVTHLAQIAAMADNHIYIEKTVIDNSTETQVKSLDFEERKHEIARIMGGDQITELMLKNAEEYILSSKKLVKKS